MKKILSILIAVSFVLTAMSAAVISVQAQNEADFTYEIVDGTATITDYTGPGGSVTIPSELGGAPVTEIDSGAFLSCYSLTDIIIPDTVRSILQPAFLFCSSLSSITVSPDNPVYHAQGNCLIETESKTLVAGCKSSVIPDDGSVVTIGSYAFDCSNITTINIPDTVTSIETYAFYGSDLTNIFIPQSVTSIQQYAFAGCSDLQSITVDPNNPTYHAQGNCLIDTESKTLIAGCKNSVIPDDGSVVSIGTMAFWNTNLSNIVIPFGITSIESWAFYNNKFTSVSIPNSVIKIESGAFSYCDYLTNVTIPESVTDIADDAFAKSPQITLTVADSSYAWQYANEHQIPYTIFVDISTIFSDVTEEQWFAAAVKYCYNNQLMSGMGEAADGSKRQIFSPETPMTRAQLVQVLYNMEGAPETTYTEQFQDVSKDQWFALPITWAFNTNIVYGTSETTFAPDANISRQEIATILYRYAEYKGMDFSVEDPTSLLQTFPDADHVATWAADSMASMVNLGVISGDEGRLLPENNARRCEVASMLSRFLPLLK